MTRNFLRALRHRACTALSRWTACLVPTCLALAVINAHGQPPAPIIIGQTTALTGGPSESVREMTLSASLYFDAVNAKGGINGRPIKLVTLDDGYDSARAASNATKLIVEHQAIGLFLSRGTEPTEAILPVVAKHKVPLIGPSTGAMSLHKPVHPMVFNVRSSYQGEAEKAVEQVVGMGITRVGLIYVDDAFGADGLAGVMKGLEKTGLRAAYVEKFDRKSTDYRKVIATAVRVNAPAVLVIATNGPTMSIIRGLRQAGNRGYVVTLSNNASSGFVAKLAEAGTGVIVSQVFPHERRMDIPLVAETAQLLQSSTAHKDKRVSPAMLEGVAAAKVLVAALRMTASATSKQLVEVLQSGVPFDIGWPGRLVRYTPQHHSGLEFTDLSIVSAAGTPMATFRR